MTVRQGIVFNLSSGWSLPVGNDLLSLSLPLSVPPAEIAIRVEKISETAAKQLRLLEIVQATLAGIYPAFEVNSLLERPLTKGICVEAILEPRQGSQLRPARFFAVLLSKHLVLFDYRRAETSAQLDPHVLRLVHGIHERHAAAAATRNFAELRRRESLLTRRALEQWQVFLCHNSKDKQQVRDLRNKLLEAGIVSWFDENDVKPGEQFVPKIEEGLSHVDAVIVARGKNGFNDWQELEYGVALNEYVRRNRLGTGHLKIIPVALPGAPPLQDWTGFLGTFNGVEFKNSLTEEGIKDLVERIVPG